MRRVIATVLFITILGLMAVKIGLQAKQIEYYRQLVSEYQADLDRW